MATSAQINRARDGAGRFRRTLDSVDRDVAAAVLHSQGKTYAEIAAELGFTDKGAAHHAVERALAERAAGETLRAARERRLLELDEIRANLWPVVLNPPPLTDRLGRIVRDDEGQPVPDEQARVNAASTLIRASERTARLQGLDAPRTSHLSVDALIASIQPGDLRAYLDRRRAELDVKVERELDSWHQRPVVERRQFLQQGLDALDAEERQAGAVPVVAEPG